MLSAFRPLAEFYERLLRPHPAERGRDLWFQEEARAERLSNFIRMVYVLAWLISTALHAPGNYYWSNLSNLGIGGIWFAWSIGVQLWLCFRPYRPAYKFLTTAADMVTVTSMIWLYQFTDGPEYALKVPTYFNYYCCLGLAALRYKRGLAIWGGAWAVILYGSLFLYFNLHYHIAYGTSIEHTTTPKVSWHYIVFQLVYLGVFSFLTYVAAVNVKRLLELRARESEAAMKAQERAVVAAGVAHEIKNPLEGIYGAAQLLREEGLGNARFIDMILKDSVRLNEVVQEFLRFARPFVVKPERFDLCAWAAEFCRVQSELAPDHPLEFSTTGAYPVFSDREGIRQILLNLVQNARRFQPPGYPLRVHLEASGEVAELRVEDDGAGVPSEKRPQLFEPFFTTSAKGTGLGLAISRKLARELGGDLYYEPREPGSRFTVVIGDLRAAEAA